MKKFKSALKKFWQDEEAQGMMEYILLAVLVVGAITIAGPYIKSMLEDKAQSLQDQVAGFEG